MGYDSHDRVHRFAIENGIRPDIDNAYKPVKPRGEREVAICGAIADAAYSYFPDDYMMSSRVEATTSALLVSTLALAILKSRLPSLFAQIDEHPLEIS